MNTIENSKTHICWLGDYEYRYSNDGKEIYSCPKWNAIDCTTDNRHGRQCCKANQWNEIKKQTEDSLSLKSA